MNLYAVTGNPILHSKSPNIFNELFLHGKRDDAYFRLAADSAIEAINLFKKLGLKGMNVTAPYKTDVIPLMDIIDPDAKKINAVNTIVNEAGKLKGYNTDFIGVTESFKDHGLDPKNKTCVIIGAGGAGKAAVYGLKKAGAIITIIDIAEQLAKDVAQEFACEAKPYIALEDQVRNADIIVYAVDAAQVQIVKEEWIHAQQIIYDVNYKPSFLNELVKNKKCNLITGADMLINQAIPAYNYYFGTDPKKQIMWNGFHKSFSEKKKKTIALIGFMGSGKTSVGKSLAKKTGYDFIDLDEVIEKKTGTTITEIFKHKGETAFRKIEQECLKQEISKTNVIIATGGGIVIHEENRKILKENALTFWLYNSVETSVERANDGTRPLLNVDDPVEKARNLFQQRIPLYAATTDMLINTEEKTVEQITEKIYAENNKAFGN